MILVCGWLLEGRICIILARISSRFSFENKRKMRPGSDFCSGIMCSISGFPSGVRCTKPITILIMFVCVRVCVLIHNLHYLYTSKNKKTNGVCACTWDSNFLCEEG